MTENDLLNQVMGWLRAKGVLCWRNNSTGVFDPRKKTFRRPSKWHRNGVSDIICLLPQCAVFIELKKPPAGKRKEETLWNMLSDSQAEFIADVRTQGHVAFVADSLDTVRAIVEPLLGRATYPTGQAPSGVH